MTTKIDTRHRIRWATRLAAIALLFFGIFANQSESQARLDPFYILNGQSFATFKPRILFALDTSGSMAWKTYLPDDEMLWQQAEPANANRSRVSAAREAMNLVIEETGDQAKFSLMTFGQNEPPSNSGQLPTKCNYNSGAAYVRFMWVTHHNRPNSGWVWDPWWGWYYQYVWTPIVNDFGGSGMWMLCGDNKPFPYLRYDDAIADTNLGNNQGGDPPDGPLYQYYQSEWSDSDNFYRDVQWFPRYLGRRVNLDCSDSNQQGIAHASWGDYGNTVGDKNSGVCDRDFYYWPYVDGYPGYSYNWTRGPYASQKIECHWYDDCYWYNDDWYMPGVSRGSQPTSATLFAPFFSQAVLDDGGILAADKGPLTQDDARMTVDGLTSTMSDGGVDVMGGTPWASMTGDVDSFVQANNGVITQTYPALPNSNAAYSHRSIASYLSFILSVSQEDSCVPTYAVLISDGQPTPWDSEGSTPMYTRLRKLRHRLGVKTFVVGFGEGFVNNATAWGRLQGMACAAAGSNNTTNPCSPINNDFDWDTCADPDNHANGCAYVAEDPEALAAALLDIVNGALDTPVPSGPGSSANEFLDPDDPNDPSILVQTNVDAYTESPGFKGHVTRGACDEALNGEACTNAQTEAVDNGEAEDYSGGETGCGLSRVWDAGECLQNKTWNNRIVYTHDANLNPIRISNADGTASGNFKAQLSLMVNPAPSDAEADAIAAFLLGDGMDQEWKLPAIPRSAPIVVRRVPEMNPLFAPTVGIRDPHCAGRLLGADTSVPETLEDFAIEAWELTPATGNYDEHYDYAEAVLIGDDMGVLHAFHLDSGNELFGYIPRELLQHAADLAANGPANYGQSNDLSMHEFGMAATVQQGFVFDEDADKWRHLAVVGFGPGGNELVALDVSHLARFEGDDDNDNDTSDDYPLEVLWTTESSPDKVRFDQLLGETWSRPALSYAAANDDFVQEPKSALLFSSGYSTGGVDPGHAKSMFLVDTIDGSIIERAEFTDPAASQTYDPTADFAIMSDPSIATHCLSRYWGEMQEAYTLDTAGRIYRWDLGADWDGNGDPDLPHTADGEGAWDPGNAPEDQLAAASFRFRACTDTDEFSCTVDPQTGDPFHFSPAVVSNNRIDDVNEAGQIIDDADKDQFIVAAISGHMNDDGTDGGDPDNDFHSSLYLMVDDHLNNPDDEGFDIPGVGGDITQPGDHEHFMRLALSDIVRLREWEYPDGEPDSNQRVFAKTARPTKPPRIVVTGAVDGNGGLLAEVFYVTYTVYEPGEQTCDERWYDEDAEEWVFDFGSTYEITFRLANELGEGFDFTNNYGLPGGNGSGGLILESVTQIRDGDCADGNCAPQMGTKANKPCDPNDEPPSSTGISTVSIGYSELDGFSPLEI